MSDVKVSIVIACYNEEHYIAQCLDSMISQTLKDIEIIVVDDGSTDSSMHIIQQYALKDHRVIVVQGQHGGAAMGSEPWQAEICPSKYISPLRCDGFAVLIAIRLCMTMLKEAEVNCALSDRSHWTMKQERYKS